MRAASRNPLVALRRGDDVILLNPVTRRWTMTTLDGEQAYQLALAGELDRASALVGCEEEEVREYAAETARFLDSTPDIVPPMRGCSVWVTTACNMRCQHCRFACGHGRESLGADQIDWYLRHEKSCGAQTVTVTGGEPLLVWPQVKQVVEFAHRNDMVCTVLTNGSLVTSERAELLAANGCHVQVSLDSLDPSVYEPFRGHVLGPVLEGISSLIAGGVRVTLSIALCRPTLPGIPKIIDWAITHGVAAVHFALLELGGRAATNGDKLALTENEVTTFLIGLADTYFSGLRGRIAIEDFEMYMRQLVHPPLAQGCNCSRAVSTLYANGQVYGCTNLAGDDRFLISALPCAGGGLEAARVRLAATLPTVNQIEKCQTCVWRWVCLGGCRDRAQLVHGDLRREDPYCEVLQVLFERLLFEAARLLEEGESI